MNRTVVMICSILLVATTACNHKQTQPQPSGKAISEQAVTQALDSLKTKYPNEPTDRMQRGVQQVASLWRTDDGTDSAFVAFCSASFVPEGEPLQKLNRKLQRNLEVIYGNFTKLSIELNEPLDLIGDETDDIDLKFGSYSPYAHFQDDMYANQLAFIIALNFPAYSLKEKAELSSNWTREQWAYARLGDLFIARVPAELNARYAQVQTETNAYIAEYNIFMGKLVNDKGQALFPADMKLITHWGLRDELKSNYGVENGLEKQQMVYAVMKRIIDQSIPQAVINSDKYTWNPETNVVTENNQPVTLTPEPDTRYAQLKANFEAVKAMDPYYPTMPTYIDRSFEGSMELTQPEVEKLFVDFISSPTVTKVAGLIEKRLGRKLQPFDIWYNGFKSRSGIPEDQLTAVTSAKYPTNKAFEAQLPQLLAKLGFTPSDAAFISSKVTVDASRGAGHASGAAMRAENARLRTRVSEKGMDYKGYNIAVHEFGHNVEQTISLHKVDYYSMNGVPNTAFTEALAFIFQKRDLELLGKAEPNKDKELVLALDNFWACYEIMGVSLVDMYVWKWMYEKQTFTPAELKEAVVRISKEVWNQYYAPVLGTRDEPILAIYSHMISYPLYLSAYPVGHLIDFQIEQYIGQRKFADEVLRMYSLGRLIPQVWMKQAVGSEISIQPTLQAAEKAVEQLK